MVGMMYHSLHYQLHGLSKVLVVSLYYVLRKKFPERTVKKYEHVTSCCKQSTPLCFPLKSKVAPPCSTKNNYAD